MVAPVAQTFEITGSVRTMVVVCNPTLKGLHKWFAYRKDSATAACKPTTKGAAIRFARAEANRKDFVK